MKAIFRIVSGVVEGITDLRRPSAPIVWLLLAVFITNIAVTKYVKIAFTLSSLSILLLGIIRLVKGGKLKGGHS